MYASDMKLLMKLRAANDPNAADFRMAGYGVTAPKGHPTEMLPPGMTLPTLGPYDDAQAFVDARIAEGSDYIKIMYEHKFPTLTKEQLAAVVRAAHRGGKLAIAHSARRRRLTMRSRRASMGSHTSSWIQLRAPISRQLRRRTTFFKSARSPCSRRFPGIRRANASPLIRTSLLTLHLPRWTFCASSCRLASRRASSSHTRWRQCAPSMRAVSRFCGYRRSQSRYGVGCEFASRDGITDAMRVDSAASTSGRDSGSRASVLFAVSGKD